MGRRDWLDYADPDAIRAEYLAGPQDLAELSPGVWGIPAIAVVCVGDRAQMRKAQAKRFHDRFCAPGAMVVHSDISGGPALPSVKERLGF